MLQILSTELSGYDFDLNSRISEITEVYDFILFIMACEVYYNFEIFDDEAEFIELNDLTFLEVEDFFIFLRDGWATKYIHQLILNNINWIKKIRPEYEWYLRDLRNSKIDSILS